MMLAWIVAVALIVLIPIAAWLLLRGAARLDAPVPFDAGQRERVRRLTQLQTGTIHPDDWYWSPYQCKVRKIDTGNPLN